MIFIDKVNLEHSTDIEKFDKFVEEITKFIYDNSTNENELLKMIVIFYRYFHKKQILNKNNRNSNINEKLNDNDSETLPYVTRCIQGFCQAQTSIDIIEHI